MLSHTKILREIVEASPKRLRSVIMWHLSFLLLKKPDFPDAMPKRNDDILIASMKEQKLKGIRFSTMFDEVTWEDIESAIITAATGGVEEPFLVTSLIHTIENDLRHLADENAMEATVAKNRDTIAWMRKLQQERGPEDWERFERLISTLEEGIEKRDETMRDNQALYEMWREVAGRRVDTPTWFGFWDDANDADIRDMADED